MKKKHYTLGWIKQNVYTFLFYFLRLSCSYSSHSRHHPSLGLSTSSLTLRKRAQTFLSGRCPFFRALHLGIQLSLHPASSLFGNQQQLTHPPVKSSTLPLRKMPVFQGVAPRHTIFTSSCVIPLWTQQQLTHPPVNSSTLPLRKMPVFQGVAPRHTFFTSSCAIPLWDSATDHSPSSKQLNPSSQEDAQFLGRCTSAYIFHFILRHPSLGLRNSSRTLR